MFVLFSQNKQIWDHRSKSLIYNILFSKMSQNNLFEGFSKRQKKNSSEIKVRVRQQYLQNCSQNSSVRVSSALAEPYARSVVH